MDVHIDHSAVLLDDVPDLHLEIEKTGLTLEYLVWSSKVWTCSFLG
jgi:hypothetical protein